MVAISQLAINLATFITSVFVIINVTDEKLVDFFGLRQPFYTT